MAFLLLAAVFVLASVAPAMAGQASTGELLFYPCTSCHPLNPADVASGARVLPNHFKGHQIVLVGHDQLGAGNAACLVCHDDPTRNPGMLKAADGSLIPITGDVSKVCFRCHESKYKEWKAGTHGRNQPKCTAAGCHNPHSPQWIYAPPLMPYVGTGFQFKILPARAPFKPLVVPPTTAAPETPVWYWILVVVGVLAAAGIALTLIFGRSES